MERWLTRFISDSHDRCRTTGTWVDSPPLTTGTWVGIVEQKSSWAVKWADPARAKTMPMTYGAVSDWVQLMSVVLSTVHVRRPTAANTDKNTAAWAGCGSCWTAPKGTSTS